MATTRAAGSARASAAIPLRRYGRVLVPEIKSTSTVGSMCAKSAARSAFSWTTAKSAVRPPAISRTCTAPPAEWLRVVGRQHAAGDRAQQRSGQGGHDARPHLGSDHRRRHLGGQVARGGLSSEPLGEAEIEGPAIDQGRFEQRQLMTTPPPSARAVRAAMIAPELTPKTARDPVARKTAVRSATSSSGDRARPSVGWHRPVVSRPSAG